MKLVGGVFVYLDEWLMKYFENKLLFKLLFVFIFDDGWQDNYCFVFLILILEKILVMIFLVMELIDIDWMFWFEQVLWFFINFIVDRNSFYLQWFCLFMFIEVVFESFFILEQVDIVIGRFKILDDKIIFEYLVVVLILGVLFNVVKLFCYIFNIVEFEEMSGSKLV